MNFLYVLVSVSSCRKTFFIFCCFHLLIIFLFLSLLGKFIHVGRSFVIIMFIAYWYFVFSSSRLGSRTTSPLASRLSCIIIIWSFIYVIYPSCSTFPLIYFLFWSFARKEGENFRKLFLYSFPYRYRNFNRLHWNFHDSGCINMLCIFFSLIFYLDVYFWARFFC